MFGTPAYHRERLAARLGLRPLPASPAAQTPATAEA
jgi:hypothetical protein